MGCTHCLGDYKPDGEDMTLDMLYSVIDFIDRIGSRTILVSGGEPTEHLRFLEFMEILIKKYGKECLEIVTNGTFLDTSDYGREIIQLHVPIQIVNDERYYPRRVKKIEQSWITYKDTVPTLIPLGRAKGLEPIGKTAVGCFNIRSIANSLDVRHFRDIIGIKEDNGCFCTPFIGIDGKVYLGESHLCTPVGTIFDPDKTLIASARALRCRNCTMFERMSLEDQEIIEGISIWSVND